MKTLIRIFRATAIVVVLSLAVPLPPNAALATETALTGKILMPELSPTVSPLCRKKYRAEFIKVDIEKQSFDDFVTFLNEKYQANIALDPNLGKLQFTMSKVSARWTDVLTIIMKQNSLGKECIGGVARIKRKNH